MRRTPIEDRTFNGIVYDNVMDMCTDNNMSIHTYQKRRKNGWTLEKALTTPIQGNPNKCTDFNGMEFETFAEMTAYHSVTINKDTYKSRLKRGMSKKEALLTPVMIQVQKWTDHLGITHESFKKMCEYHNINVDTVNLRLKNGMSIEEALTVPVQKKQPYITYNNIEYDTCTELCTALNIPKRRFVFLLGKGHTKEEAIIICLNYTEPKKKTETKIEYIDHLGIKYKRKKDMLAAYNVNDNTFNFRIRNGWSLKDALLGKQDNIILQDIFGNSFTSIQEACDYHHRSKEEYLDCSQQKTGLYGEPLLSVWLGIIPRITIHHQNFIFRTNFEVKDKQYNGTDNQQYWKCIIDGEEMILSKLEIYKRMEEIVIEEYKATGSVQTAES